MSDSKRLTEGALLAAVYIVLLLLTLFVPLFIMIGIFLLPIPFIIYTYRHSWQNGLLMFLVVLIVGALIATIASVPMTLFVGLGGIIIGYSMQQRVKAYETWARGTLGFIASFIVVISLLFFVLDINIFHEIDVVMEESFDTVQMMLREFGMQPANQEQLALLEEQMQNFKNLIPSSIAIVSIVIAFVSQWLSYKVTNRLYQAEFSFPPFRQFNLPIALLWIYFIAIIASLFEMNQESDLAIALLNVLTLTAMLLVLQGFSFLFFFSYTKNIPVAVPIVVIVLTVLFPPIFLTLVRIIGIIDLGFSLKKRLANGGVS